MKRLPLKHSNATQIKEKINIVRTTVTFTPFVLSTRKNVPFAKYIALINSVCYANYYFNKKKIQFDSRYRYYLLIYNIKSI